MQTASATAPRDAVRTKISTIVVDDESAARSRLRRLLSTEPDVEIVAECEDGRGAVAAILERTPDLVFLDVEMPELNGFEVLRSLPNDARPAFVFVTAFSNYSIEAFAVEALDYLLKPFDAERFQVTMRRARERIAERGRSRLLLDTIREIRTDHLERIAVKRDGSVFFVRVEDVDYFEAAANYVKLHVGGEVHLIRERLSELATRLDPKRFARIHRSTIVNTARIKEIQPWFSGDAVVILHSGQRLRLSRLFRTAIDLGTRSRL